MVVFEPLRFLAIATAVWLLWRIRTWRRNDVDPARELAVLALFGWSLNVVGLTFFPLRIVFYDWHGTSNLIPFASILQLIRETNSVTANYNITGNIVLFVPFGFLLPLLFTRLRRLWPLAWRAAAISVSIEIAQIITRARSSDVDDVILNTLGAVIGFTLFALVARAARGSAPGTTILERLGSRSEREPLLGALIPIGVTVAIVAPMMLSAIVAGTLGDGPDGIVGYAVGEWPAAEVVARTSIAEHTFLMVSDGPADAERLRLFDFERVMPGRYTWVSTSEIPTGSGSRFSWNITSFNTERNERPVVVIWGTNRDGAASILVTGNRADETLSIPPGPDFVVAFTFDMEANVARGANVEDFSFVFVAASGDDVSHRFDLAGR
jgi:hypothetical protein